MTELAPKLAAAAIVGIPATIQTILADAALPTPVPEWMIGITQISAFGLVAWIVFFMFTKWLPNIQAAHAAELTAQRVAHAEAMRTIAEAHMAAVAAMTKSFAESLQCQRTDLLALVEKERKP